MLWQETGGRGAPRSPGARPTQLPYGDFRVAVAFYPASCNEQRLAGWTSAIPLLALLGAADVWTPAGPCKALLEGAVARKSSVEIRVYPDAYHGFDRAKAPLRESPEFRTQPASCRSLRPTLPPGKTRSPASRPFSPAS
jgi:dienelactone hydrolase